jgi:long-chain-fatty-acid--CoA ligase ACSBG
VGLYPTNSSSVNKFILEDCKANILLVEEEKGVNKILEMKNELPDLKKIVQVIFLPTHRKFFSIKICSFGRS